MSRYTSFVAIDQTPSRSEYENLKKRSIANSMPAGSKQLISSQVVASQAVPSIAYPKTALGINGLIFSGVLSLFLALIVLCLKQDRHVLSVKYAIGSDTKDMGRGAMS